jgi:DNA-binding NarL/FixJ family response regulator
MLETIREFGLEQLAINGEAEAIASRHAAWCVHLADRVRQAGGVSQRDGLALLEEEHPNFRAALTWNLERGETTAALHLAGQLAEFWLRHGHVVEGGAWLERVLAADAGGPTVARAEALVGLNMLCWGRTDFKRAERLVEEAETIARTVGDAGALAYARLHQGYVAAYQHNFELAQIRAEESLAAAEAIPQRFSLNGALWLQAVTAMGLGENDRAADFYARLLTAADAEGDAISIANSHFGLATLAQRRGDLGSALAGLAEATMVCRRSGDRGHASMCLDQGASVALALGAVEAAVRLFAVADAMRTATGAVRIALSVAGHVYDEQLLEEAQATLGAEGFAAAWAAGSALSLDEAVAELTTLLSQITALDPSHLSEAGALTTREREILRLLVDGQSDKEIAATLYISPRTVSKHVAHIRDKLNAPSRTAAATLAVRFGHL